MFMTVCAPDDGPCSFCVCSWWLALQFLCVQNSMFTLFKQYQKFQMLLLQLLGGGSSEQHLEYSQSKSLSHLDWTGSCKGFPKARNSRKFGVRKSRERCIVTFQMLCRTVLCSKLGNRNSEFIGSVWKEMNEGIFFACFLKKSMYLNVCKYAYMRK